MKMSECTLFSKTDIDVSRIKVQEYPNNYTVALEGDISQYLGIVLEGKILVKAYSLGGKDFTINSLEPGMIFGDVLLFGTSTNSYPGNLVTKGRTKLAIIPNSELKKYIFNNKIFLKNFLHVLSDKVFLLNFKNKMLSQDSIRDKIFYYLYQQIKLQGSNTIKLNMSKEELANQLFVQRPSLSRELIKMRNENLIDFDRWTITVK